MPKRRRWFRATAGVGFQIIDKFGAGHFPAAPTLLAPGKDPP
jgi:hypothetical protein